MLNDRLTAVLGYAELLLEGSYGSLTAEQKQAVLTVVTAARDVRDIFRQTNDPLIED
jgi:hypothetical protein